MSFQKSITAALGTVVATLGAVSAQVDIEFDGTFRSGQLIGSDVFIEPAPGSRAGGNQFFSFSRFNVPNASSAVFRQVGPNADNVFARVTGGQISSIGGHLGSEWQGAHFFFMNPNGVIFSDGASVDMAGSFTVTTADYIEFNDGFRLGSTPGDGQVPILSAGDPVAFGFLARAPAAVSLTNTSIVVPRGESINLIAGNISIDGPPGRGLKTLDAEGGAVSIISVASPGVVHFNPDPNRDGERHELEGFSELGRIDIKDALIDTSAADPGGGRIVIRGGQLVVVDSRIASDSTGDGVGRGIDIEILGETTLSGSAVITSNSNNSATGGAIHLRTGALNINTPGVLPDDLSPATPLDRANLFGGITAANRGSGTGGSIHVDVKDGATISGGGLSAYSVLGSGPSGSIDFRSNNLIVTGDPLGAFTGIQSVTAIGASGRGGDVDVRVDDGLVLRSGGSIRTSAFASGDGGTNQVHAGSILIDGQNVEAFTGIATQANQSSGDSGALSVTSAGTIDIVRGGRISSNSRTSGNGGSIDVEAASLHIDGSGSPFATGITAESHQLSGGGDAGAITVDVAGATEIYGGGSITSSTFGDGDGGQVSIRSGSITAERRGSQFFTGILALAELSDDLGLGGDAGDIDVAARSVRLREGALIDSSTFGGGSAGSIALTAGDLYVDRAGSEFFTGVGSDSDGSGPSGSIDVSADRITLMRGGLISTGAFQSGDAGDITVEAKYIAISGTGSVNESVVVTPRSGIVASTGAQSSGTGGNVSVRAGTLRVSDAGLVGANTTGAGDAGSVSVDARGVSLQSRGEIGSRSTASGNAGSVAIATTDDITVSSGGRITVEATEADAGSIRIATRGDLRMNRGSINAVAGNDGGDVSVSANEFIRLGNGSEIVAEAGNDGGNVTLSDAKFAILDDSRISANAVQGTGGNVQIGTEVLLTNNSPITASSQFGADGTVRIDAIFDLSGSLAELDDELLDASAQLQPRCSVRIPGETGSFVLVGRGGLPTLPGRYMPSHQLLDLSE